MRKSISLSILLLLCLGCVSLTGEVQRQAEFPLPNVDKPMETADFWINRLPEPGRVIMSEPEIAAFNRENARPNLNMTDILDFPSQIGGKRVAAMITPLITWAKEEARFGHDNFPLSEEFFEGVEKNVDRASIPGTVTVRYGITVDEADLRVIPTRELGMESESDYEFDQLQASLLSLGTPVAVIWESADREWLFVVAPYASGWVAAQDLAIARSKGEVKAYLDRTPFLVVTGPAADIFSDRSMTRYAGKMRLGGRLPLSGEAGGIYTVLIPFRRYDGALSFEQGYVGSSATVHKGYLPYTQANVIRVIFTMEGQRYGWGGMYGYWDCSSFVRDVFSAFGIRLPRNSTSQAEVGTRLGRFEKDQPVREKVAVLDISPAAETLLVMPGHVMIYLGQFDGKYYAVNDLWAFRTKEGETSIVNGVGRVAVSELSLGEGGKRGSLIERITDIVKLP